MCFTIEPMISLGTYKDKTWPDNWTSTTADGKWSAQFGAYLGELVEGFCMGGTDIVYRTYSLSN